MKWEPINPENVGAKLSKASEHAISDFKTTYDTNDPTKSFEIAKDVCAFANHLGGTMLVGVREGSRDRKGCSGSLRS
jgi:predicted HTH transcriptional regulator